MRSHAGKELREPAHLHRRLLPLIAALVLPVVAGCDGGAPAATESPDAASGDASSFLDAGSLFDTDASLGEKVRLELGGCRGNEGCHVSGEGDLTFPVGDELRNVVAVPSFERPELLRVKPGDPAASYLYLKVRGDGGIDGSIMPPGVGTDPRLVEFVHAWIEAGAP